MKTSSKMHYADKPTRNGILSRFVEKSVEMPPDGLNGYCVVHYSGQYSTYKMIVPLVNGVREGKGIILHNGLPTLKCYYTNGVSSGDVDAVEEWERMLIVLGIDHRIIFNSEGSLLYYDVKSESIHGIVKSNEKYYAIDVYPSTSRVVMVDMNSKELVLYSNRERSDTPCTKEVIDLDTNGKRWEGSARNGKPFGYGVVYGEEGGKEYEGFMIYGMRTCYGIEYYSDISRVEYEGCYHGNKRYGVGTLYDRKGTIEYEGIWKNDTPYSSSFDGKTIDDHTESIDILNNSFNEPKSFIFPSFLQSLNRIVIGNDCFGKVRLFKLDGLSELESLVIEKQCMMYFKYTSWNDSDERKDGVCRIVNCPKLKSIQIGGGSFSDYCSFELSNLPSLESIDIGDRCFYYAPALSLIGLIDVMH